MCIAVFTLSGCGSTPETTELPPVVQVQPQVEQAPPTAEEWLAAAHEASSNHAVQLNLVFAARAFLDNNQPHHAGAILIDIDTTLLRPEDMAQFRLQSARFYAAIEDWPSVMRHIEDLEQRLTNREDRLQVMRLNYQAATAQQQHFRAGEQLIQIQPYLNDENLTEEIWIHLRSVPADVWRSSPRSSNQSAQGWFSLLRRLTTALDQQTSVLTALEQWQHDFPHHSAQTIAAQLAADPAITTPPQHVAVLLPLTGAFEKQGHAVRYGILAALAEQGQENVHFIDSNQSTDEQIIAQLENLNIELVIGPLDRALVDRVFNFTNHPWLQLALNHAPEGDVPAGSSYFALDIAAETQAAAAAMKEKDYQGILLLGPNTNRGRQLSDLFTRYWHEQQPNGHIRTGYYATSTEMRNLVREQLKVAQSEDRKTRIESLIPGSKIEMDFRSRQDIDAIYLLGDATQARLLNPFINVSLSTFATPIPVYANSTVNEEAQTQGESDLSGIHFADAPWLLPQHTQLGLHNQMTALISGWSRSEQRLTAMGYDAMRIAPRLALMQQLSGYEYNGLSGQLRIQGHTLVRELSWAMFDGNHIRLEPLQNVYPRSRN
ncbi:MAG TPA: penicillin-binding protein activator [Aliidiomarina sp.]|nr:penicillin-binding protein activator [Aliidiomarina sp.]